MNGFVKGYQDVLIGLLSPNILSTRYVSSKKNITMNTKGASWYSVYNAYARFGSFSVEFQYPDQLKPVSSAIYPVPMNSKKVDNTNSPKDIGVPSSINWYPTTPFSISIHAVAVTAAM